MIMGIYFGNLEKADLIKVFNYIIFYKKGYQKRLFLVIKLYE